jgi:hypothetical protein
METMSGSRIQVAEKVGAYFLGLGADEDVARERAEALVFAVERDGLLQEAPDAELLAAALAAARQAFEGWLEVLLAAVGRPSGGPAEHTLVALRIRPALQRLPRAFLDRDEPPAELIDALRSFDPAVVPPRNPKDMPAQPIGDLPDILLLGFWRGLARRVRSVARQVLITLTGG